MERESNNNTLIIVSIFLIIAGFLFYTLEKESKDIVDFQDDKPQIRLLFIGNSLTYQNEVPKMICNILNSSNSYNYYCHMIAKPGAKIIDHLTAYKNAESNYKKIDEEKWNMIIFQEQSQIPGFKGSHPENKKFKESLLEFTKNLSPKVNRLGLMATWGFIEGDIYNKHIFKNYSQMQGRLTIGFFNASKYIESNGYKMEIIPAALAFSMIHKAGENDISAKQLFKSLYSDDRHLTLRGSYLAALKMARHISKQDFKNSNWIPVGLDKEIASTLRKYANKDPLPKRKEFSIKEDKAASFNKFLDSFENAVNSLE